MSENHDFISRIGITHPPFVLYILLQSLINITLDCDPGKALGTTFALGAETVPRWTVAGMQRV